jgi:hypothetical protein
MKKAPRHARHASILARLGVSALTLFSLSACAAAVTVTGDYDGARAVVISHPVVTTGFDGCIADRIVETALQTASLPPSGIGITLRADTDAADVRRLVDCLRNSLLSGSIEILGEV